MIRAVSAMPWFSCRCTFITVAMCFMWILSTLIGGATTHSTIAYGPISVPMVLSIMGTFGIIAMIVTAIRIEAARAICMIAIAFTFLTLAFSWFVEFGFIRPTGVYLSVAVVPVIAIFEHVGQQIGVASNP